MTTGEITGLLRFAAGSEVERGFAWLDDAGRPQPGRGLPLWITARMTYVFALASVLPGLDPALAPEHRRLAEHGVRSLATTYADPEDGGWFREVAADGEPLDATKACYEHDFVVLAAATAAGVGVRGADALLAEALRVHETRFLDPATGLLRESWSRDWTVGEAYRGANSGMHGVEAYLVAADVTGDPVWRDRALGVVEHLVHRVARAHDWRVVEHFDEQWRPDLEHHADRVDDPFRPYGATPGHGFEWARLAVQLDAALPDPPAWLLEVAVGLFDRAAADTRDGVAGFCYTTGWDGVPVVRERFHWVVCEAVLAAEALHVRTGEASYADLATRWWADARRWFVQPDGSWVHELGPALEPSRRTWDGRPDAYHAFNALVLPSLPLAPSAAAHLRG